VGDTAVRGIAERRFCAILLAQVPGRVDALPIGVAKVAVLEGRRVARQGAFTGSHEVKA
jgi:hypothetical protein